MLIIITQKLLRAAHQLVKIPQSDKDEINRNPLQFV